MDGRAARLGLPPQAVQLRAQQDRRLSQHTEHHAQSGQSEEMKTPTFRVVADKRVVSLRCIREGCYKGERMEASRRLGTCFGAAVFLNSSFMTSI